MDDADVILGQGDPNLANFLWDGTEIRIVDFEDSGPSSRAFELAILVEHVSAWSDGRLDPDAFAALFDLTNIETAMLREFRRLAALFWLITLRRRSEAHRRDHDHVLTRQAERVLALLGERGRHRPQRAGGIVPPPECTRPAIPTAPAGSHQPAAG
jgi:Ser/Thr protein kinase RdoA (MazF antagonist)